MATEMVTELKNVTIVTKCCKCDKILVNNRWLSDNSIVSNFLSLLGLEYTWSHGYCPSCLEKELVIVRQSKPSHFAKDIKENTSYEAKFQLFKSASSKRRLSQQI